MAKLPLKMSAKISGIEYIFMGVPRYGFSISAKLQKRNQ